MKLNHLSLPTAHPAELADFFVSYFDFVITRQKSDCSMIALTYDGFDLVIQASGAGGGSYPKDFHFGFILGDMEQVQAAHARLKLLEINKVGQIVHGGRGAQFFVTGPDGINIEIACHI
ncbi:VOC family protein [Iodobacter sp. LRB]|uniref:VOC family protein n=1 Tax=unclassified Iodobacter TaxID=235634 RepID=UPI000C115956|nr:VOC family protein [Iodobacter sp. BJB302]PHV01047.1 extradiol dioxygenase [Iodobacter sp. BJB302]